MSKRSSANHLNGPAELGARPLGPISRPDGNRTTHRLRTSPAARIAHSGAAPPPLVRNQASDHAGREHDAHPGRSSQTASEPPPDRPRVMSRGDGDFAETNALATVFRPMRTAAILVVKSFSQAKQRLRYELSDADRRALVDAMFSDVLVALRRVSEFEGIIVVSGDRVAQRIAQGYGATVVEDDERGHNSAATDGVRVALGGGIERALLVPGDCPLLDPNELKALLAHPTGERSALIVPDRHGTGTNALLLTPPDVLAPSFGPGSCQRHTSDAGMAGVPVELVAVPSLALDIDTPDDLDALERQLSDSRGGAAHTRGMLNQLARARS
jgi:2-phospho-L-lactate/phosphoenolpyruvate guanylyltransferase